MDGKINGCSCLYNCKSAFTQLQAGRRFKFLVLWQYVIDVFINRKFLMSLWAGFGDVSPTGPLSCLNVSQSGKL